MNTLVEAIVGEVAEGLVEEAEGEAGAEGLFANNRNDDNDLRTRGCATNARTLVRAPPSDARKVIDQGVTVRTP